MARFGRKRAQQWIEPLRKLLRDILKTGEIQTAIDEHTNTKHALMEMQGDLVRVDYCFEGFARLIRRAVPEAKISAVMHARDLITSDQELTVSQINEALSELNILEPKLGKLSMEAIKSASLTEQIAFEMEKL